MDFLQRRLHRLDRLQTSHKFTAVIVAVIKKYGEDRGGNQAALLTYYGFLSLFPALLVTTTAVQWLLHDQSHLKQRITASLTNTFPLVSHQLQQNVHGFSRTGLPLIIGLLFLIYGLRGTADVFRHTVNNVWRIPNEDRSNWWSSLLRNLAIIGVGAVGYVGTAATASYAATNSHTFWLWALLISASSVLIFFTILLTMRIALNKKVRLQQLGYGAAAATIGLILLQNLGGHLLAHELRNLNSLYGTFAVVLGLFFWLYVQAQILVYAVELDSVRGLRLWPRRLFGDDKKPS